MARKMSASMEKLRKKAQYQPAVRFIGVFGSVNEEIVNRLLHTFLVDGRVRFGYERGPIIVTSNRAFKIWTEIFNNDSTLTSALLDRLLHHAETVVIEGKSYRMKDQVDP